MQTNTLTKTTYKNEWLLFLMSAIVIVLFLFYIDEGNYSLKGFTNPGHIIVFFIYVIPTFLAQVFVFKLLTKFKIESGKLLFSIVCGLFLGIAAVIVCFICFK
jgi:4-hydroxybenzoate polyprenyltransferase